MGSRFESNTGWWAERDEPAGHFRHLRLAVSGMTCGSSVSDMEYALLTVQGVVSVEANLLTGTVEVGYEASQVSLPALRRAIQAAGYKLSDITLAYEAEEQGEIAHPNRWHWPLAAGFLATALLTGLYVAIVGTVLGFPQGLDHTFRPVVGYWYFMIPIMVAFGIQVGLFVYVRRIKNLFQGARSISTFAGAGASTVSIVACCAYRVTSILPVVGGSGMMLFLSDFRGPLMILAIFTNITGIAAMARVVHKSTQASASGPAPC